MTFLALPIAFFAFFFLTGYAHLAAHEPRAPAPACRYIPGDAGWPSLAAWAQLNQTVGGRLISIAPQAAVCHTGGYGPLQYNSQTCESLKESWDFPYGLASTAGDIANPFYQNYTCIPFTPASKPCELRNFVSYAINVDGPDEVIAGVNFTRANNVRLVIKNTGLDLLGKSTGKGGLSLWMHNRKSMEIIPAYSGMSSHAGPAVKLGSGVTGSEALEYVQQHGYSIVVGECPTVGVCGGYSQGGGHSTLMGEFGPAADNVLEWEVVTVDGRHLIASQSQNADLYWALTGGGAGTYAIVLSMTSRIHYTGTVGDASLGFMRSAAPSNETFLAAVQAWWEFLPAIIDTHTVPLFGTSVTSFNVSAIAALNKTASEVQTMFKPYLATLRNLGIPYDFATETHPTYFDWYSSIRGPLPFGPYPATMLFNSRFIPRAISTSSERAKNLTAAVDSALSAADAFVSRNCQNSKTAISSRLLLGDAAEGFAFGCNGMNVGALNHPDNALSPVWRSAMAICYTYSLYNWYIPAQAMYDRRKYMADVLSPAIEAATSDSGAYLNERDPLVYPASNPKKWQDTFYGTNYKKLRQIKNTWDPESLLYANTAVGAELYYEDGDGRLCRGSKVS